MPIRPIAPPMRLLAALLAQAALAVPASAQVCQVPGQRDSIQAAAKDPACVVVNVAAGTYPESVVVARPVWINGASAASTTILGRVVLRGAGTELDLSNLAVDARGGTSGCYPFAVPAATGTVYRPSAVSVRNGAGASNPCPLFTDGFDYGQ
jgi:hypothetical protein